MRYSYIVVDDEPTIRKGTIKKLEPLKEWISCVGQADNGSEAMTIIDNVSPDIIITDMNMPIMDGIEFLNQLSERYSEKRIIIISGHKDFQYLQQAIKAHAVDYIIKPFGREDIQRAVLKAVEHLKSTGDLNNRLVAYEEKQEQAQFELDIRVLQGALLGHNKEHISFTSEKFRRMQKGFGYVVLTFALTIKLDVERLQQHLADAGFGDLILFLTHIERDNLGNVIIFSPHNALLTPRHILSRLCREISQHLCDEGGDILIGVSRAHNNLNNINTAYNETLSALNHRTLNSDKICFFDDTANDDEIMSEITWDKIDELLFRIECGAKEQTRELLDEMFIYLSKQRNCTLFEIKTYCVSLADRVGVIIHEYNKKSLHDTSNRYIDTMLNGCFFLSEVKSYFWSFFLNAADMLNGNNVYAIDDVVEKIKIYLEKNYQNNLTIEFLSSLFYLNSSYCSHIFRVRTAERFVDYLNRLRINKAKQYLRETDQKMYRIAKMVGYDNTKYFFRIFKKHVSMTPQRYRDSFRKDKPLGLSEQ